MSRIDAEKLPTLKSFILVCAEYGIDFDVAGPVRSESSKVMRRLSKLNIPAEKFIGPVDTVPFLLEKGKNYLFVGGVGQVALEAASIGMPVLIPTHTEIPSLSTFLTNENFDSLLKNNFTIKDSKSREGNIKAFFASLREKHIDEFVARKKVESSCSEKAAMSKYVNAVFGDR